MRCATMRPIVSVGPPAENGTTSASVRDGKVCPDATGTLPSRTATTASKVFISTLSMIGETISYRTSPCFASHCWISAATCGLFLPIISICELPRSTITAALGSRLARAFLTGAGTLLADLGLEALRALVHREHRLVEDAQREVERFLLVAARQPVERGHVHHGGLVALNRRLVVPLQGGDEIPRRPLSARVRDAQAHLRRGKAQVAGLAHPLQVLRLVLQRRVGGVENPQAVLRRGESLLPSLGPPLQRRLRVLLQASSGNMEVGEIRLRLGMALLGRLLRPGDRFALVLLQEGRTPGIHARRHELRLRVP